MMADYEMEGKILKYDVTGKNKFIMNLGKSVLILCSIRAYVCMQEL